MTRLEIVKHFIELTGRYDLVIDTTGYATATPVGVDFFINAGSRWLDHKSNRRNEILYDKRDIAAGDAYKVYYNIRAVKEVWMTNASGRHQLAKKSLGFLRENYGEASAETNSKPLYWAPTSVGFNQNQLDLTALNYESTFTYDVDDNVFGSVLYPAIGILWMPPADVAYTLTLYGQFFEPELSDDDDTNFWSVNQPETLLQAAMLIMERFHRNREGVREHKEYLSDDLRSFDFDTIEQDISGENQLRG